MDMSDHNNAEYERQGSCECSLDDVALLDFSIACTSSLVLKYTLDGMLKKRSELENRMRALLARWRYFEAFAALCALRRNSQKNRTREVAGLLHLSTRRVGFKNLREASHSRRVHHALSRVALVVSYRRAFFRLLKALDQRREQEHEEASLRWYTRRWCLAVRRTYENADAERTACHFFRRRAVRRWSKSIQSKHASSQRILCMYQDTIQRRALRKWAKKTRSTAIQSKTLAQVCTNFSQECRCRKQRHAFKMWKSPIIDKLCLLSMTENVRVRSQKRVTRAAYTKLCNTARNCEAMSHLLRLGLRVYSEKLLSTWKRRSMRRHFVDDAESFSSRHSLSRVWHQWDRLTTTRRGHSQCIVFADCHRLAQVLKKFNARAAAIAAGNRNLERARNQYRASSASHVVRQWRAQSSRGAYLSSCQQHASGFLKNKLLRVAYLQWQDMRVSTRTNQETLRVLFNNAKCHSYRASQCTYFHNWIKNLALSRVKMGSCASAFRQKRRAITLWRLEALRLWKYSTLSAVISVGHTRRLVSSAFGRVRLSTTRVAFAELRQLRRRANASYRIALPDVAVRVASFTRRCLRRDQLRVLVHAWRGVIVTILAARAKELHEEYTMAFAQWYRFSNAWHTAHLDAQKQSAILRCRQWRRAAQVQSRLAAASHATFFIARYASIRSSFSSWQKKSANTLVVGRLITIATATADLHLYERGKILFSRWHAESMLRLGLSPSGALLLCTKAMKQRLLRGILAWQSHHALGRLYFTQQVTAQHLHNRCAFERLRNGARIGADKGALLALANEKCKLAREIRGIAAFRHCCAKESEKSFSRNAWKISTLRDKFAYWRQRVAVLSIYLDIIRSPAVDAICCRQSLARGLRAMQRAQRMSNTLIDAVSCISRRRASSAVLRWRVQVRAILHYQAAKVCADCAWRTNALRRGMLLFGFHRDEQLMQTWKERNLLRRIAIRAANQACASSKMSASLPLVYSHSSPGPSFGGSLPAEPPRCSVSPPPIQEKLLCNASMHAALISSPSQMKVPIAERKSNQASPPLDDQFAAFVRSSHLRDRRLPAMDDVSGRVKDGARELARDGGECDPAVVSVEMNVRKAEPQPETPPLDTEYAQWVRLRDSPESNVVPDGDKRTIEENEPEMTPPMEWIVSTRGVVDSNIKEEGNGVLNWTPQGNPAQSTTAPPPARRTLAF